MKLFLTVLGISGFVLLVFATGGIALGLLVLLAVWGYNRFT